MRKNVLLIDESHTIHKIVELTIEKQSYELFSAYNAEEGLALAASNDIDCVLIDVLIVNEDPSYVGKLTSSSSKAVIVPLVNTFNQFQDLNNNYPFITNHVVKPFNAPALNLVLELAVGKAGEQRKQDAEERETENRSEENTETVSEENAETISEENTETVSEENAETASEESIETESKEKEETEDVSEDGAETETSEAAVEAENTTDNAVDQTEDKETAENHPVSAIDTENTDSENSEESDETIPLTSLQDRYGDIPEKESSEVTRNDLVLDTIEQDVELEILQDYMVKSEDEAEESSTQPNENVYGDISLSDAGNVPDVSTVIDIMDKVIATEQIDTNLGKLELELSDESFDKENVSESFMGYGDVEFNESPASTEAEELKTELDDIDNEFKGVMVELGETNEALFTSDTKEREEIMDVFPSDEKNEQAAGFKKIAEKTVSADKTSVARLYFELPRDEFVELFKKYLDKTTIDYLLHDTVKSILDKILSETLEKSVRKELERIIKGN
jgi:DNA-binding response OmpR family regulator